MGIPQVTVARVFAVVLWSALVAVTLVRCAPPVPPHDTMPSPVIAPQTQFKVQKKALSVACDIDGVVVPLGDPVVAQAAPSGASDTSVDALLTHPAVVHACSLVGGRPAIVLTIPPDRPSDLTEPAPTVGRPWNGPV